MRIRLMVVLLLAPVVALGDFEMRFSDGSHVAVGDGNVRFGDDNDFLLALAGEESMIIVTGEDRSWMRVDAGFADDVQSAIETEMEQMLAGMSPEERAMVEAQLGQMMPQMGKPPEMPKMTVHRTGKSGSAAGYDCTETEIRNENGTLDELVCVATARELGIDGDDFDTLEAAMRRMQDIVSMMPGTAPEMDLAELGGMPIKTIRSAHGDTSELVSVDTGSVDASFFRVPDGYTEMSMDDMMR